MSHIKNISVALVAAGMFSATLPALAQASDIDALKAQVQKLGEEVKDLQNQQKVAPAGVSMPAPAWNTLVVGNSSLTFYGDIDLYANHMTSSSGKTINALEDGSYLRSRWGFRGFKDYGDGYKAKFCLEGGINGLTGQGADMAGATSSGGVYGGRLFDRQAWVGMATPIGEFRIGRQNTTIFFNGGLIDFGERTLGSVINYFGVPSRVDNDIAYFSPRMAGFLFELHYAIPGATATATSYNSQRVYQYALDYRNGNFDAGYMAIVGDPMPGSTYQTAAVYDNLYANYDYGRGKVWVAFVHSNNNGTSGVFANGGSPLSNVGATASGTLNTGTVSSLNEYYNITQLSADYRLTKKLRLGAIWGQIHDTSSLKKNNTGWDAGFYYQWFKDTLIYGLYDVVNNSANAGFRQAASAALPTNFTVAGDVNGQKITGVQLGFMQRF